MADKHLIYTPGKRTIAHRARSFLAFKHKHDGASELIEFVLITTVFILLFLKHGDLSHVLGVVAHVATGVLLFGKLFCIAAWKVSAKYQDIYGVEP